MQCSSAPNLLQHDFRQRLNLATEVAVSFVQLSNIMHDVESVDILSAKTASILNYSVAGSFLAKSRITG